MLIREEMIIEELKNSSFGSKVILQAWNAPRRCRSIRHDWLYIGER